MAKRVAYRKNKQNRVSMFLVTLVVGILLIVVSVRKAGLKDQLEGLQHRKDQLDAEITAEEQRSLDIEEYRKYTQTDAYKEEIARDKLGLVYPDEIIIKKEKE
ncbi:MAG: septum formation initiator family protein [Acetatifactor sp.]|nr:septum formation initiator family protein [Acetatifactor sp.]